MSAREQTARSINANVDNKTTKNREATILTVWQQTRIKHNFISTPHMTKYIYKININTKKQTHTKDRTLVVSYVFLIIYFASATIALDSSHMTASSSAS